MHFLVGHAEDVLHDLVALADELDVSVLDAVVDHLDEMSCTAFSYPVAAGRAVRDLGADALEDGLDIRPGGRGASGHHGRTLQGTFLAAGDTCADIQEALALHVRGTTRSVRKVGVATVDDDVPRIEDRDELVDKGIDGGSGLDHQEHLARSLERSHEILEGMGAVDIQPLTTAFHEPVNLLDGAVEHADAETLALHVQHEVLAHHGETDQSNIR